MHVEFLIIAMPDQSGFECRFTRFGGARRYDGFWGLSQGITTEFEVSSGDSDLTRIEQLPDRAQIFPESL